MANRPRRPRTGGTQGPANEAIGPSGSEREDGTAVPASDEPALSTPADEPTSPVPADEPILLNADAPAKAPSTALPAPQEQPEAVNESARRLQSDPEGSSDGDRLGEERVGASASATELFAAEEGLAAKAGEPTRRDLGEFEDDDATPHDRTSPANPPVSDAYRDRSASAVGSDAAHAGRTSFGSLVGAGVAGAVLSLLGAALLSSAGLFPGGQAAPETGQFAQAGDLESVSSEVATLREAVAQLQSAEAAGGAGESFASTTDLSAVSDRLAAAEQTLQQRAGTLEESSGVAQAAQGTADSAQVAAEEARTLAGDIGSRVDEIGTRMDDVETRVAAVETAGEQARIALAAAGLKAAIDRGGPFMPELEAFASSGGDVQAIEPLRQFAANGVPTQADLVSRWPEVEADIRRSAVQPEADAGLGSQLAAGFSSLVTVRSTEDPGEDASGPDAALARMSSALQSGDLSGWLSAREELAEPAKAASADYAAEVEARQQAASVVDAALAGATVGATDTQG